MATIVLPGQLVLGDFGEAAERVAEHARLPAHERGEPLMLDAGNVRCVDGSGLQWLLACLIPGAHGTPIVQLESNPVVDEALRLAGASALLSAIAD